MNVDQWMNYFSKLDKSLPVSQNWNNFSSANIQQFNVYNNGKTNGKSYYPDLSIFNFNSKRINYNSLNIFLGSESSFNFSKINNRRTKFDNSNIFSFNNSRLNNFGYMFGDEFNFDKFSYKNWMNEMNYEQFLEPSRRKKNQYSNRPIVYIANIDDYRNGYRNDNESDYDDYDSEYDDVDSEYEDDYDLEYDEPQQRPNQRQMRLY